MLKGKHVSLFAVEKEDLQQLRDWRNNQDFRKYFREYRELNMAQQEKWFEEKVVKDNTTLMFSIRRNEDNELLGCCGFVYINWVHRHADLSLYIGVGLKNRSPSYQELYLWTPMESTGGLADGNTYIGDINLESETAYQADIGFTYKTKKMMIAPHVFYQNIDNYIQGTPLGMENMSAIMMAQMMAGDDNPLKFTNVDAKLYGADVNGHYYINSYLQLSAVISYVRGERRDIHDNLYRIAPLNGEFSANYFSDNWSATLALVMAAAQEDVSLTNEEQESAGYGVINVDAQYYVTNELTLRFGVDNLLDKKYDNHLGGYNRVKGTEITVMGRLPAEGISAWAEMTYSF